VFPERAKKIFDFEQFEKNIPKAGKKSRKREILDRTKIDIELSSLHKN
jgi:hypothetical protein